MIIYSIEIAVILSIISKFENFFLKYIWYAKSFFTIIVISIEKETVL